MKHQHQFGTSAAREAVQTRALIADNSRTRRSRLPVGLGGITELFNVAGDPEMVMMR